ncbi:MAG TPA: hypothetical protein RMH99_01000, partial [Sandaracinaceae bacterium LLY-WYZ-13_1]|nr:hypothetical protein [Sandaracinaceae bacterium LLY-WYZ-13_1]
MSEHDVTDEGPEEDRTDPSIQLPGSDDRAASSRTEEVHLPDEPPPLPPGAGSDAVPAPPPLPGAGRAPSGAAPSP